MKTSIVLHTQIVGNDTQQMTSLEIAELTGKQHKHVMEAIRRMEPAWVKTCGSNFRLTSRIIDQPNGGTREVPCYQLTKTECLYIATKFNDEARAKLVLRWEELEKAEVRRRMSEVRCLPEPKAGEPQKEGVSIWHTLFCYQYLIIIFSGY